MGQLIDKTVLRKELSKLPSEMGFVRKSDVMQILGSQNCAYDVDKVETPVKKPWSKWYLNEIRFTDINGKDVRCNYLYRTNGKKVQVRSGSFKAEATCCKDDEFEIEKGLNLAKKRLVVKCLDNQVKSIAKAM